MCWLCVYHYCNVSDFFFFFFFQAEDGIRDGALVTGVQTCALPILRELRGITVYVKGRTLVPLDFATAHIAGTNRVSMTRIKFWRVTEIDAECVFPSGGINCIAVDRKSVG